MYYTESEKNYLQDILTDYLDIKKESEYILEISSNPIVRATALEAVDEMAECIDETLLLFFAGDLVPMTSGEPATEAPGEMEMEMSATAPTDIDSILEKYQAAIKSRG